MKNLARHLYEFFYFTRQERNSTFVLLVLISGAFLAPAVYRHFMPPAKEYDFSKYEAEIAAFMEKQEEKADSLESKPVFRKPATEPVAVELFKFDPNSASKEDLLKLGLSSRTAQTLINFRSKGGSFYRKEDLKKVYGLRAEDYNRLEPWIEINQPKKAKPKKAAPLVAEAPNEEPAENLQKESTYKYHKKERVPVFIDINKASPEEWQQLYGIGPAYSKRIVKFRDKLGGFASIDRIGKTYGLPDSTFQKILPYLKPSPIFRKIKINSCSLEELKVHPLISNYQATILFNYRHQHGKFSGIEDLKKIKAGFEKTDWNELGAYFSFE